MWCILTPEAIGPMTRTASDREKQFFSIMACTYISDTVLPFTLITCFARLLLTVSDASLAHLVFLVFSFRASEGPAFRSSRPSFLKSNAK